MGLRLGIEVAGKEGGGLTGAAGSVCDQSSTAYNERGVVEGI